MAMAQKKYQSVGRARAVKMAKNPVNETPRTKLAIAVIQWRVNQA